MRGSQTVRNRGSRRRPLGHEPLEQRTMMAAAASPGVLITPSTLTVKEGQSIAVSVKLKKAPTAAVTIGLTCNDTAEAMLSTNSVTFDQTNWSKPQRILLRGVEDFQKDGTRSVVLSVSAPASTDLAYSSLPSRDIVASVKDSQQTVAIAVSSMKVTTSETDPTDPAKAKASFWIKLNGQPTADVTIPIVSSNEAEGVPTVSSVTFTSANWNTEQKVFVRGVDDGLPDATVGYRILTGPATSTDTRFANADPADVVAANKPAYYAAIYDGTYSGSFSGAAASGTVDEVTIRDGVVTVAITIFAPAAGINGTQAIGTGTITKNGKFTATATAAGMIAGAVYTGTIGADPITRVVRGFGKWKFGSLASGSWEITRHAHDA